MTDTMQPCAQQPADILDRSARSQGHVPTGRSLAIQQMSEVIEGLGRPAHQLVVEPSALLPLPEELLVVRDRLPLSERPHAGAPRLDHIEQRGRGGRSPPQPGRKPEDGRARGAASWSSGPGVAASITASSTVVFGRRHGIRGRRLRTESGVEAPGAHNGAGAPVAFEIAQKSLSSGTDSEYCFLLRRSVPRWEPFSASPISCHGKRRRGKR